MYQKAKHKMFKQIASAALAATAALVPQAAMAEQLNYMRGYRYLDNGHNELVRALTRVGVQVQVNVGSSCEDGSDGVYFPQRGVLAVCQDNAPRAHWSEVRWTANDLDTLRHEAVHVLQDCNAGDGLGGYTRLWFETEARRVDYVTDSLSQDKIRWIIKSYGDGGADEFTIKAELEAFAIAATVNPESIAKALNSTCRA